MNYSFENIIKSYTRNHNESLRKSRLLDDFPTVHNAKQEYVFNHELKFSDLEHIDTFSTIIDGFVSSSSCGVYIRKIDDASLVENLKHSAIYVHGGCHRSDIFADIDHPVIVSFNESTNTLDVLAVDGYVLRPIGSITKMEHVMCGYKRHSVVVTVDDLKRLFDVYNRYSKRVSNIPLLNNMHSMEGENGTFLALSQFARGNTPEDCDLECIQDFISELRSFADDLEDLSEHLRDCIEEESCKDEESCEEEELEYDYCC